VTPSGKTNTISFYNIKFSRPATSIPQFADFKTRTDSLQSKITFLVR